MVLYSQKLQVKIRTPKDLPNVSKIWKTHPSHCVSKTRILRLNNLLSNIQPVLLSFSLNLSECRLRRGQSCKSDKKGSQSKGPEML